MSMQRCILCFQGLLLTLNGFDIIDTLGVYSENIKVLCKIFTKYITAILEIYPNYLVIFIEFIPNENYYYYYYYYIYIDYFIISLT